MGPHQPDKQGTHGFEDRPEHRAQVPCTKLCSARMGVPRLKDYGMLAA